jgi:hypothetical protein
VRLKQKPKFKKAAKIHSVAENNLKTSADATPWYSQRRNYFACRVSPTPPARENMNKMKKKTIKIGPSRRPATCDPNNVNAAEAANSKK